MPIQITVLSDPIRLIWNKYKGGEMPMIRAEIFY